MNEAPRGLLHARLLDGSGGGNSLSWEEVGRWTTAQGCLWLHFDYEDEGTQHWLAEHSDLSEIAVAALLNPETRPRAVNRGNHLLLALRGINRNPGSEPDDMVSLRLWTDGTRVISTRRRKLQSTQDLLDDLDAGAGPRNVAELLAVWTDRITQGMSATVDSFEEQVDDLEERVLGGEITELRVDIAQLRKQCITVRRYLAPQREAMNRLVSEPLLWIDEFTRLRLREINDRLIRHIEDIDAIRERAAMSQEELLSRVSEEMNRRTYVFTVVATIFLPLGFFTGLMGINVGGMPGVDSGMGFWVVAGLCAGITVVLALLFRLRRWL